MKDRTIEKLIEERIAELVRLRNIPDGIPPALRKLGEEFGELAEAVAYGNFDGTVEEAAGCMVVLWRILQQLGLNPLSAILHELDRKILEAQPKCGRHTCPDYTLSCELMACKDKSRELEQIDNDISGKVAPI